MGQEAEQSLRELPAVSVSTYLSAPWSLGPGKTGKIVWQETLQKKVLAFGGGAVSKRDFGFRFTLSLWQFLGELPFCLGFWTLIVGIDAAAITQCLLQPPHIGGLSIAKCHFHAPQCMVCNYNWFATPFVKGEVAFSLKRRLEMHFPYPYKGTYFQKDLGMDTGSFSWTAWSAGSSASVTKKCRTPCLLPARLWGALGD